MIYLIHFNNPIGSDRHQARHYLGWVARKDLLEGRIKTHRMGWGAKILAHCNRVGIRYNVVRTMPGGKKRERQIKNTHNLPAYCPICRQKRKANAASQ